MGNSDELRGQVCETIESFFFFHLGADAQISIRDGQDRLTVSVSHQRVEPFQFRVLDDQLENFSCSEKAFEGFLLEQLNFYRR